MEPSFSLHSIIRGGSQVLDGARWGLEVEDSSEDLRIPKKRRYFGEESSRFSWDCKGTLSTDPPTPVLIEPQELADLSVHRWEPLPMYSTVSIRASAGKPPSFVEKVVAGHKVPSSRGVSSGQATGSTSNRNSSGTSSVHGSDQGDDVSPTSGGARVRWTETDDRLLIQLVSELGHNWPQISTRMEGRTSKQVKERWTNQLDPSISTEPWTSEDDYQLVLLIRELGHSWCEISRRMPGRTESMVKNRFHANLRKRFGNNTFDPSIPLPLLTFRPKTVKSKKNVITEDVRAAAALAAKKAMYIDHQRIELSNSSANRGSLKSAVSTSFYFGDAEN